ncbi:MAG: hypothetical protein M3O06_03240 [Pseudomonadota bacterium]|nr:hypothetical protein [Pseudomonadota bacterium]
MVETPNMIATHIEVTRHDLQSNLNELEDKVRSAADWRQHYRKHAGAAMAAALGGGLLLAMVAGGRSRRSSTGGDSGSARPARVLDSSGALQKHLDDIKGALIAVAATQTKGFISKWVPGFVDHLPKQAQEHVRAATNPGPLGQPGGQH